MGYMNDYYPLRAMSKMEFFKDTDDIMGAPWAVEISYEGKGDRGDTLIFNFEMEQHRLNFALTMRILRTRDPLLDENLQLEVVFQDDEEEEIEHKTFNRIVAT